MKRPVAGCSSRADVSRRDWRDGEMKNEPNRFDAEPVSFHTLKPAAPATKQGAGAGPAQ